MGCRGKCDIELTKIMNEPLQAMIDTDPPGAAAPAQWADNHDSEAATKALMAQIKAWAGNATSECKGAKDGAGKDVKCECHQTDPDPSDADWATKKTLSREFRQRFASRGSKWLAKCTVEYKVAFVAGACEEPAGPIYVAAAVIEGTGYTLTSVDGEPISDATLEKVKRALA